MTKEELAKVMDGTVVEIGFLREAGQKEYAHSEDNAFANFERVSAAIGVDRMKVLLVYAMKHLDGIIAAVNGHMSQREPVEGRINDLIVYLIILKGMFLEEARSELTKPESGAILSASSLREVEDQMLRDIDQRLMDRP